MAAETLVLDRVDRQILHALQISPRAAFARIADVLQVSEQTVARRYQRLRTNNVLRVVGMPDPTRLPGSTYWTLRIGCRPGTAAPLADALARRGDTAWVSIDAGGAEITCQALITANRDGLLSHLGKTSSVLTFSAHQMLHRFAGRGEIDWIAPGAELDEPQRTALTDGTTILAEAVPDGGGPYLEPSDKPLLDALARDGRASWAALAELTGATQRQIAQRVNDLFTSGSLYFHLDVIPGAVGFRTLANLWFTVAPADLAAVGARLADHNELAFAAAMTGTSNIMAAARCRDAESLYRYITTKVAAIDGVRTLEVVPQLTRVKGAYYLSDNDRLHDPANS